MEKQLRKINPKQILFSNEESEKVLEASKVAGLAFSSFVRFCALEKSNKIVGEKCKN